MTEIKLGDKAIKMAFTFKTMMILEDNTGKSGFGVIQTIQEEEKEGKCGTLAEVAYMEVVTAARDEEPISADELLSLLDTQEKVSQYLATAMSEIVRFFTPSKIAKKPKKGDSEGNA